MDTLKAIPTVAIFVGTVQQVTSLGSDQEISQLPDEGRESMAALMYGSTADFRVERYWGGARIGEVISIETPGSGGACGVPWEPGECFLVEAWFVDGAWHATTCSMTAKLSSATADLERLNLTDGPGARPD